jgi:hypothetical protein
VPITSFTIAGVEVEPLLEEFDIRETVGGTSTLSCDVMSVGSPVRRFSTHQSVEVQEDGVTIFAGTITQVSEKGYGGPNIYDDAGNPQIVSKITAEDYCRFAERMYVTHTVVAGTLLKSFLTTLVGDLATLGVTLHGSQVNGPALPAFTFDQSRADEVLKALSDATGYLWRIDYDKKLRMWLPGDLAAPFDIDEYDDPSKWTDDVEVQQILGDNYANRVTVVSDPISVVGHIETFTGDGVDDSVTLEYKLTKHYGYVTYDGIFQTLRTPDDPDAASWTYDPADNSLTRTAGPIESGKILSITFDGTFTARATAEDAGEIALYGPYEYLEHRSDITTNAAAQDLADSILAERLNSGDQIVSYNTRYAASTLRAGQQQSLSATARNLSGDYIITDLEVGAEVPVTAAYAVSGVGLIRKIKAKRFQAIVDKWQGTYHDWLGGGKSSGTATTVGDAGPASQGPALPDASVQFNRHGSFGGDDDFTYDEATSTVMVGLGHTPGGEDNVLIGSGHTVN